MNHAKIQKAEIATDIVTEGWWKAQESLQVCFTNGYGVLSDPSMTFSRLHGARGAIDKAMRAISTTNWPTNADYDE